jgi:bleomycin hydrolase
MTDSERAKWEKLSENELLRNSYSFSKPVVEVEVTEIIRQKAFDNYEVTDDHLMHLTGLLKDQNGTFYYLTKNSWAEKSNAKGGFLNMSEAYLRLNTVAIMVHKNALPQELKKKLGLN